MAYPQPSPQGGTATASYEDVPLGERGGRVPITVLGPLDPLPSVRSDVSTLDSHVIPTPRRPLAMEVASTSDDDRVDGEGVHCVEIHGLVVDSKGNWREAQEEVVLSGTEPKRLEHRYIRINSFHTHKTKYPGNAPHGDVEIRGRRNQNVYARMVRGANEAGQAMYTVPDGFNGYLFEWSAGSTQAAVVVLLLSTCDWKDRLLREGVFMLDDCVIATAHVVRSFGSPLRMPPRTDIKLATELGKSGRPVVPKRGDRERSTKLKSTPGKTVGSFSLYLEPI